jgi:hypothetical protein
VGDIDPQVQELALELAQLAASVDDPAMACRLIEMADEVLALAGPQQADPEIYHSAIFFLHTGRANMNVDPYADDRSPRPTQRN